MERQALGYSLGRAKCRHGNGVRTSFLSKPWMARRLAGCHALTATTMQGQPGRARGAGYSGRAPGPGDWPGTSATPR